MLFASFRDMRPAGQIIWGLFIVLVCTLVGLLLSYLLSLLLYGGVEQVDALYLAADFNNPTYIGLLRLSQVLQSVATFGLPPLLMAYLYAEKPWHYLYLDKGPRWNTLLHCLLLFLCALPLVSLTGLLNEQMNLPDSLSSVERWMKSSEEFSQLVVQKMVDDSTTPAWVNYVVIAVFPALVEELLFRGVMQRLFIRASKSVHWGIWLSAIVFSAIHMQFYGFLPRLLLGALFGYIVHHSASLWIGILLHFMNNAFALYLEFYKGSFFETNSSQSVLAPETLSDVGFVFVFLAATGAVFSVWLLQRLAFSRSRS